MKKLKLVAGPIEDSEFYEDDYDEETGNWREGEIIPYKSYAIGLHDDMGLINDYPVEIETFYAIMNGLNTSTSVFTCGCGVSGCAGYDDSWEAKKVDGIYVFSVIEDGYNDNKASDEIGDTTFAIDLEADFEELFAFDEANRKGIYYDCSINPTDDTLPPYMSLRDYIISNHERYKKFLK